MMIVRYSVSLLLGWLQGVDQLCQPNLLVSVRPDHQSSGQPERRLPPDLWGDHASVPGSPADLWIPVSLLLLHATSVCLPVCLSVRLLLDAILVLITSGTTLIVRQYCQSLDSISLPWYA